MAELDNQNGDDYGRDGQRRARRGGCLRHCRGRGWLSWICVRNALTPCWKNYSVALAGIMSASPADLSDGDAVDRAIQQITDATGGIDHVVHTVGGFAMGDPVHAGDINTFEKMMALNARMTYLVCGKIAAYMIDAGKTGSINMILARAGRQGSKNMGAYTASKAAATRIMESMAAELKEHHIRVNGISPSIVDTPPNRNSMPDANFDDWVKPAQIGDLAVFLARNEAMTGANIAINAWS